jgi:beta-glucanase (GH16 family)
MNHIKELDNGRYDMTIDYFTKQVKFNRTGGVELTISQAQNANSNPDAPRLSTTRFLLYGRVTAVLRAPAVPGVVTTFITMGPHLPDTIDLTNTDKQGGDEIDWELLGNDPMNAQSNIFYRGFREFSVRGGYHNLTKQGGITAFHKYTIDWKRDEIIFSIDDVIQRRYLKNSTQANSREAPGRRFYPDRFMNLM